MELFELYDSVCEVKEGCSENDWKDGNPSNEDEPPPLLKEEEEV